MSINVILGLAVSLVTDYYIEITKQALRVMMILSEECGNKRIGSHSVLIKPVTLEFRHFLNLTSLTVLFFFLVLYVIVEQSAILILWIFSLLSPP